MDKHYPETTVGALILNKNNQILLIKSHKWSDQYVIPGGHIEMGESMEDALKREIKEETGLDVFQIELFAVFESIYNKEFIKNKHFIFLDFSCKTNSNDVILNEEGQEFIWIDLKERYDIPVERFTQTAINKFINKHSI